MKKFIYFMVIITMLFIVGSCDSLNPTVDEVIEVDYDAWIYYPGYNETWVDRTTYDEDGDIYSSVSNFYDWNSPYHYSQDDSNSNHISIWFSIDGSSGFIDSGYVYLDGDEPSKTFTYY